VELISGPSVMFLDGKCVTELFVPSLLGRNPYIHIAPNTHAEPTSGLDSFQAQSVVSALKTLAGEGRTIVTVIHQPRSSIFQVR